MIIGFLTADPLLDSMGKKSFLTSCLMDELQYSVYIYSLLKNLMLSGMSKAVKSIKTY